jgi:hypothetical protein
MDIKQRVSPEEAARARHIIWSMNGFGGPPSAVAVVFGYLLRGVNVS